LSLLFDIGLEVQFGVFIYSFVVLWCWKWLETLQVVASAKTETFADHIGREKA